MSATNRSWLETIRGAAPILLIAPHGGRAGAAAAATLHPKVNDLETAAIARELAARLDASALINSGMDRNQLDCNRVDQIAAQAPWLLELIKDELARILDDAGRATVLLIHGWNIIEPRVDLGLGVRERAGRLQPTGAAFVSASDAFINGPAAALSKRLRAAAITPSFGLRYPGGGAQNLLQAFTQRHAASTDPRLRAIAQLATERLDALQLELSVALRLPGPQRRAALDAVVETFSCDAPSLTAPALKIDRGPAPLRPKKVSTAPRDLPLVRIGVEFYDPETRLGGMASFDFGPNAAGGRIMMLFERHHVALFTGEGGAAREGSRLSLGPLSFDGARSGGALRFSGPAVVVSDSAAYLSVERALAQGRIDPAMEVEAAFAFEDADADFASLLATLEAALTRDAAPDSSWRELERTLPRYAAFGRLRGFVRCEGRRRELNAVSRVGISFTALGPQRFVERRMVWACSNSGSAGQIAVELRELRLGEHGRQGKALVRAGGSWREAELPVFALETQSALAPPDAIHATVHLDGRKMELIGTPETFMSLSRPGADGARIHTMLGFSVFQIGQASACGMYEYSRRVVQSPDANGDTGED